MWEPLIRYCYGPEALLTARRMGEQGLESAAMDRPRLKHGVAKTIEDIRAGLKKLRAEEQSGVKKFVESQLETELYFEVDETVSFKDPAKGPVTYEMASAYGDFIGQVVVDDDYVVYGSLVSSKQAPDKAPRRRFSFLSGIS